MGSSADCLCRPTPGFIHPLSRSDIITVLRNLREEYCYGIRTVEVTGTRQSHRQLTLGRLLIPGRIVLFEQPQPPWMLDTIDDTTRRRLRRSQCDYCRQRQIRGFD